MSTDMKMALRNIWRSPIRTILTMSAIAFAALILVFMLSFQLGSYETMVNSSVKIHTGHFQIQAKGYNEKQNMRYAISSPEEIAVLLMAHDIPYQLRDWKLYFSKPKSKSRSKHNTQAVPAYQFYADKHLINLIVLSENQRKLTPLNPGNWQAIQKASLTQVEAMLE